MELRTKIDIDREQVAKTCHASYRAFCLEMGKPAQPEWSKISEDHKNIMLDSVNKILDGKIRSREASHDNFVALKEKEGWKYSAVYSEEKMTNPKLVEFEQLSSGDRLKETLFYECAASFRNMHLDHKTMEPLRDIISKFIASEEKSVKIPFTPLQEVIDIMEGLGFSETNYENNGWQVDFWYSMSHDDHGKYAITGSLFYGDMSISKKNR
jgi:hypothetical protein